MHLLASRSDLYDMRLTSFAPAIYSRTENRFGEFLVRNNRAAFLNRIRQIPGHCRSAGLPESSARAGQARTGRSRSGPAVREAAFVVTSAR